MAVFNFSALADGQAISFDPDADVLNFDETAIAAADIRVVAVGSDARLTYLETGKEVTLLGVSPLQLATSNVTFADGSRLLFGDDSSALNDNLANTLAGSAGLLPEPRLDITSSSSKLSWASAMWACTASTRAASRRWPTRS